LLIAAVLRLGGFQEVLIGADQSTILSGAANLVALRGFPLIGMKSSVGVMQTATPIYLAAMALALVHKVVSIKWFFSILDILALAYLYRSVGRVFDRRAALIAGLLYATNPWIVEFNRWIWYQTLLPTFATVAFAALLQLWHVRRPDAPTGTLALAIVASALLGTVHIVGLPWAGLLFLICLVLAWRHRLWHGLLWGTGGALLISAPYLVYLVKTRFSDIALILRSAGDRTGEWNWLALRMTRELLTGEEIFPIVDSPVWAERTVSLPLLTQIFPWILGAAVLGLLYQAINRQKNITAEILFPIFWSLLAPFIFLRSSVHIQHFYLLFLFPAPFVVLGVWLSDVGGACAWRWLKRFSLALVLLLAGWWMYIWGVRIWSLERHGMLIAAWRMDRLVDIVEDHLNEQPESEVIILTHFGGERSYYDWVGSFTDEPDRVRAISAERGFIIPEGEVCYLVGARVDESHLWPVREDVVLQPQMTIPGLDPWEFYCRMTSTTPPDLTTKASWQHGIYLLSAEVPEALDSGGTLDITYRWYYDGPTLQTPYHLFNHLWGDDALVTQVDGVRVPSSLWRKGDRLLMYFQMPLPETLDARVHALKVGFYAWPDITPIPLQDGSPAFTVRRWPSAE
jgi:hypothetical protein